MNPTTPDSFPSDSRGTSHTAPFHPGILFASAALLLVLIAVRLSALIAPAHAFEAPAELPADVVSTVGDYTMLTLGADNDDVLIVLDTRNEALSAYRVKNKTSFDLVESRSLKSVFAEGRRIGSGK